MNRRMVFSVLFVFLIISIALIVYFLYGGYLSVSVILITLVGGVLYVVWLHTSSTFRLTDTIMSRGKDIPNLQTAIDNTVMELANEEMIAFHCTLFHSFFEDPKIIKALEGRKYASLHTSVVFGPKIDVRLSGFLRLVKTGRVSLYQLKREDKEGEEGKFHHFVSVDKKHVWLEKWHRPQECGAGKEWLNEPQLARFCLGRFNKLKKRSRGVDPNNIIKSIGKENFIAGYKDGSWIPAEESKLKELAKDLEEQI